MEREVAQAEVPITYIIVRRLLDRSDLLGELTDANVDSAGSDWAEKALVGRADEVRRPEPGSRRPPKAKLPGSRDSR